MLASNSSERTCPGPLPRLGGLVLPMGHPELVPGLFALQVLDRGEGMGEGSRVRGRGEQGQSSLQFIPHHFQSGERVGRGMKAKEKGS